MKEQLEVCTHDAKRRIKEITAKVEGQVGYHNGDSYTKGPGMRACLSCLDLSYVPLGVKDSDDNNDNSNDDDGDDVYENLNENDVNNMQNFAIAIEKLFVNLQIYLQCMQQVFLCNFVHKIIIVLIFLSPR